MISDRRFDHELPELLTDLYLGPTPDYRDDILLRVARTPQRRVWTFPERWLPMSVVTLAREAMQPLPWRTIGLLALLTLLVGAIVLYAGSQQRRLPAPFGPAANGALVFADAGDIVAFDQSTGTRTTVVGGPAADRAPAFSRVGSQLAFLRDGAPGAGSSVWVSNPDGSNQRRIAEGVKAVTFEGGSFVDGSIEWSPDGRSLLLSTNTDIGHAITIVPVDGSSPPRTLDVGMRAEGPTWRPPNGGEILFRGQTAEGYGLYAVQADGMNVRTIVPPVATTDTFDLLFYSWSPDGSQIAFQRAPTADGPRFIHVVRAAGGEARAVTSSESVGAQWSPDGRSILYSGDSGGTITLNVVSSDGTGRRELSTSSGAARWTPDGRKILLAGEDGFVLIDLLGGPPENLAFSSETLPDWQRLAP